MHRPILRGDSRTIATSAGRLDVEEVRVEGGSDFATVLIAHGADGMEMGGMFYRGLARQLARAGFEVLIPDYYGLTGSRYIPNREQRHAHIREQFPVWAGGLAGVVGAARDRSGGRPVGLLGVSLGAALSLTVAAHQAPVEAVTAYFGWLPREVTVPPQMPPVLILHGDEDEVIPVASAEAIRARLAAAGHAPEVRLYPGQGHGFRGHAARDALRHTSEFFRHHLTHTGCPTAAPQS